MAAKGISPQQVDQMELWQMAAALGVEKAGSENQGEQSSLTSSFQAAARGEIPKDWGGG